MCIFFFKQKTAYEFSGCFVGSEKGIRERIWGLGGYILNVRAWILNLSGWILELGGWVLEPSKWILSSFPHLTLPTNREV